MFLLDFAVALYCFGFTAFANVKNEILKICAYQLGWRSEPHHNWRSLVNVHHEFCESSLASTRDIGWVKSFRHRVAFVKSFCDLESNNLAEQPPMTARICREQP